jgi:hypothetical protein
MEGKVNSGIPSHAYLLHLDSLGSHLQSKKQDKETVSVGLNVLQMVGQNDILPPVLNCCCQLVQICISWRQ